jgi:O-antigen/teichoic acid export membrane protein
LGVVINQASKNAISILIGTILGAVNTILILPKAFEGFEEGWGLLKVMTAYALIFSQFFHGGIPNTVIRYFPQLTIQTRPAFLRWAFTIPVLGSIIFLLLFLLLGNDTLRLVQEGDAALLQPHRWELIILTISLIVFYALNGYLSAVLKTTVYQFLNETFLKAWFMLVALLFWFDMCSFETLLFLYVGGYVLASVILLIHSLQTGLSFSRGEFPLQKKELYNYSFYSILDRGAAILVNNLDIIMVGMLIGLNEVAYYTLAFYIGSVSLLPQKSLLSIANPITSKAIAEKNHAALLDIYRQSSQVQLLFGGYIFVSIWVCINEILHLLPNQYQEGMWVVFFIGMAKMFYMATGVSGGILVYSQHYRLNFRLNLILIFLTIGTNYLFISPTVFDMGITGAALATALSFMLYNSMKVYYVRKYFKITPFTSTYYITILWLVTMSALFYWQPFPNSPFIAIILKGMLTTIMTFGVAYYFKLAPEAFGMLARMKTRNK